MNTTVCWLILLNVGLGQGPVVLDAPEAEPEVVPWVAPPDPPQVWFRSEYLFGFYKSQSLPPLVTSGPATELGPSGHPGVLGNPGTSVVLGDDTLNVGGRSGGRFTAGAWLDNGYLVGLETDYFWLGRGSRTERVFSPTANPPLALPFFNDVLQQQDSTGIAIPFGNAFGGGAAVTVTTQMQGAELSSYISLCDEGCYRLHFLLGCRWLNLSEAVRFSTASFNLPPAPSDLFVTFDEFKTRNDYVGAQLGLRWEYFLDEFSLLAVTKLAIGDVIRTVDINGVLTTNDFTGFGSVETFPAGYFALPTNIGHYHTNQFAAIPELDLLAGWQVTNCLKLTLGYTFIYINSAVRPGDQIDTVINPSQGPAFTGKPSTTVVGPLAPVFPAHSSDFWLNLLNAGLELNY